MKKIFISIFIISLSFSFVNAESKNSKSDDELIADFMSVDKESKEIKAKKNQIKKDRIKLQEELEKEKKIGKTLDEIKYKLAIDKK